MSGFFRDDRGVAQSARLTVNALRNAGFSVVEHDITSLIRPDLPDLPEPDAEGGVWIAHCNPPEGRHLLDRYHKMAARPFYRVGSWAWELEKAPSDWLTFAADFHEVWTLSSFSAQALAGTATPVRVMRPPIATQQNAFRQSPSVVSFLHVSDLRSSAERKNPLGAIEAYCSAFEDGSRTHLTLKISGGNDNQPKLAQIQSMIATRGDIDLIQDALGTAQMKSLVKDCDVLVSLHRAEGYGLPLTEAMALGKSVVTTGWSGVLDFMTGDASVQLVPYRFIEARDDSGTYANCLWAEPDIEAAAALMRRLSADAPLRRFLSNVNRSAVAAVWADWDRERLLGMEFVNFLSPDLSTHRSPDQAERH